ncbi:DUF6157 family protein [Pseudalkalibacillus sp. A8]|uniref:DUF6157 family protein n=1 Tax=Pseudalkalibacillus sp. A8 TaxID=3382641 RepID=UPI0038B44A23
MSYKNTFITISEDSGVSAGTVPASRSGKPTIASIEYDLIKNNPYRYTQEDVQFKTYLIKNQIESGKNLDELREQFFSKPKACLRASPLVKKYGWGIHYDEEGKVALVDVTSNEYAQFLNVGNLKIVKGMRSKRT